MVPKLDPKEIVLLARARSGDREAFAELVEPYRERIYATAVRLLGNAEDAQEITQEAFLRTFWKLTGFRGQAHFYTWLYRIALNLCYRRLITKRREPPLTSPESDSEEESVSDQVPDSSVSVREKVEQKETIALVRQALTQLKSADFEILILREFEGLSYEELADRLRIQKGTVMSRLHRARLALAEQLTKLHIRE